MTSFVRGTIRCPECGREFEGDVYQSVNVTVDPDLFPRLCAGKINIFLCEGCGMQLTLAQPLLYHDMERGVQVFLFGPEVSDEELKRILDGGSLDAGKILGINLRTMDHYAFRIVRSYQHLIEKAILFYEGIDDRYFEVFKLIILRMDPALELKNCFWYLGKGEKESEPGQKEMWFVIEGDPPRYFTMPSLAWEDFRIGCEEKVGPVAEAMAPLHTWKIVDEAWALDLIEHFKEKSPARCPSGNQRPSQPFRPPFSF